MNVLWITTLWPEPIDSGGKIVTAQLVRHLAARGHRITLCALDGRPLPAASSELSGVIRAVRVPPPRSDRPWFGVGQPFLSAVPHTVAKYWSEPTWEAIRNLMASGAFDVIHLDHLHTASYGHRIREAFSLPIVMTSHNVESVLWERLAARQRHPVKRAYLRMQRRKLAAYEASVVASVDCVHALSDEDARRLSAMAPEARTLAQPPGVNADWLGSPRSAPEPGSVVFVGSLDWPPNAEGMAWFRRHVWPRVQAAIPSAMLTLVGPASTRQRRRWPDPRVTVTGWVEDVRPFVDRAQVVIVPLHAGSGVRIKLLEALARGKAVVATSVGAEGLDVEAGRHLHIADSPTDFADRLTQLLRDPEVRRQLGDAGQDRIRARYRWPAAAERIDAVYRRLTTAERSIHTRVRQEGA
ncbi:MAG: glycosyltransferase family 4 protein [Salinibacter sp.]